MSVLLAVLLGTAGAELAAQGGAGAAGTVSGVLRHGGPDGAPLAGRWVVLHQVTQGGGGPVDSTRTDAGGRWRLRAPRVDTLAIYIASTLHDGLAYFSAPLHVLAGKAATADPLVVYDTSSGGPGIALQRRLVTIARAGTDGSREVLELLELVHGGRTTRVAPDTIQPVWTGAIPAGAVQFEVQTGDFSPDAVTQRGDNVLLFAPLQPGHSRQLSYRYVLPASGATVVLPIDQPTSELDLLLEDTSATVTAPGLTGGGVEQLESRRFAGYRADSLPAGAPVSIVFPAKQPFRTDRLLPIFVVVIVVALGSGLWIALKRKPETSDVRHRKKKR